MIFIKISSEIRTSNVDHTNANQESKTHSTVRAVARLPFESCGCSNPQKSQTPQNSREKFPYTKFFPNYLVAQYHRCISARAQGNTSGEICFCEQSNGRLHAINMHQLLQEFCGDFRAGALAAATEEVAKGPRFGVLEQKNGGWLYNEKGKSTNSGKKPIAPWSDEQLVQVVMLSAAGGLATWIYDCGSECNKTMHRAHYSQCSGPPLAQVGKGGRGARAR